MLAAFEHWSAQQKVAVFNLVVAIAAIVGYFALLPTLGPLRASGAFAVLGIAGFSWLFYRKRPGKGVLSDERERVINQRASLIGKSVIWVGLILVFMVALFWYGETGLISMRSLGAVIFWAVAVFLAVHASATLILSARQ